MSHGAPEHHGEEHHEAAAHGANHGSTHGAPAAETAHSDMHGTTGHRNGHTAHAETPQGSTGGNGHGTHAEAAHGDAHGAAPSAAPKGQSEFAREARSAWERARHSTGGFLLAEKEPVEEVSLLKTPFYIIRDWVRGSIGNVFRRGKEILAPAKDTIEASWNTFTRPFTSPVQTLFHPIKYLANIPRIITAGVRTMKNSYKAPITGSNEAYQGIVQDPLTRVDYKLAKVPPKKITGIIARVNNGVANVMGWPLRAVDGVAKWATNWIDDVDGYFAAAQHG